MASMALVPALLAAALAAGAARPGTVYRFVEPGWLSGTVWLAGDDARCDFDPREQFVGWPDVEIWRSGGRQRLRLYAANRTYHDTAAGKLADGRPQPSLHTLTVDRPFEVTGAREIRVELAAPPEQPSRAVGRTSCRPAVLTFSYVLELRLERVDVPIPARVEGSASFCLADSLPVSTLPFGHGREIVSGIADVDAAFAQRLAALAGVPLERTIRARRRIEGGDEVSATETLVLSDFRSVEIPADRFEVPSGYRYEEPHITPPVRLVP